jgi:hypothetical protein
LQLNRSLDFDSSAEKVLDFIVKSGVLSDFLQDEAGHLRTLHEEADRGPRWEYAFNSVARHVLDTEWKRDI